MYKIYDKKALLFWHRGVRTECGYSKTYLCIYLGTYEEINRKIGLCVNNEAGYQDQEAANRVMRDLVELRKLGYDHVVDIFSSAEKVEIEWQHFEHDADGNVTRYCRPHLDLGDDLDDIKRSLKRAEKIGMVVLNRRDNGYTKRDLGNWVFDNPDEVVEALKSMPGTQEYAYEHGPELYWKAFCKGRPAPSKEEVEQRRKAA